MALAGPFRPAESPIQFLSVYGLKNELTGALRRPGAALRSFGASLQTSAAVRPQKPLYRATHPSPITVVEIVVGIVPY